MGHSDSEDEGVDDLEFDRTTDAEGEDDPDIDDDALDTIEADAGHEDATEGDDVCYSLAYSMPSSPYIGFLPMLS
jgi:transcriptional activator SPT8